MAFENLSEKLQNIFRGLRGKGKLKEEDVRLALKEVRMALLEADVQFKVVKDFVKTLEERTIGQEVLEGLNPAQTVIKAVNEELIRLMCGEQTELAFQPGKSLTVVMMLGLQGAGKTTATAKIAAKLKTKGKKPLLAACDVYRPAAIEQLKVNGAKVGVDVFAKEDSKDPVEIAREAVRLAKEKGYNPLILDTAGRLHIDEAMMAELEAVKAAVEVHQSLLVVDAMTGQDAVNVAKEFDSRIGVDGVVLTKLDGDARGGAALSIKAVTGRPILYVGVGEKLEDLDIFYPDRMASRILGMGDVLSLIEKASQTVDIDPDKGKAMAGRMKKGQFDFEDYLESMKQMRKMGGLASILGMLPGMGMNASQLESMVDEKQLARMEAIVLSMTPQERCDPKLLNPRRKHRIAKGAGVDVAQVNRFVKQFEQSQKMMKQLGGGRGRGGMPFGFPKGGGFPRRGGFPF